MDIRYMDVEALKEHQFDGCFSCTQVGVLTRVEQRSDFWRRVVYLTTQHKSGSPIIGSRFIGCSLFFDLVGVGKGYARVGLLTSVGYQVKFGLLRSTAQKKVGLPKCLDFRSLLGSKSLIFFWPDFIRKPPWVGGSRKSYLIISKRISNNFIPLPSKHFF